MDIEVLKLAVSICALVVSILTLCGFGVFMSLHTKKRFEKREAERQAIEDAKTKANNEALMKLINAALDVRITPLANDVTSIKSNLSLNTEGTVTLLRNDMKKALDYYKERGWASTNDKASWMELYKTYEKLGGNHFKEYVDGWKQEVKDLPLEKKKTKKKLNENK